jgi:transcriptional regulator with XRE-family HTH domain
MTEQAAGEVAIREKILAIRKELKRTQAEIAKELGVSRSTVSKREIGKAPVTPENKFAMQWLKYMHLGEQRDRDILGRFSGSPRR